MKKQLLVLGLVLGLCMGTSSVAYAAQIPVVSLTEQEQFEYYMDSDEKSRVNHLVLTQFAGMTEGDMRTQTIRLHNNSTHSANFYITSSTISALQIHNLTSNGRYRFRLQVGKSLPTAKSLLCTPADKRIDQMQKHPHYQEKLSDFVYIATLDAGNEINLFLTFKIERDNQNKLSQDDYVKMLEEIPIAFRAYDHDAETVYVENTKEVYNIDSTELALEDDSVQSGDSFKYGLFGVILLAGVVFASVAVIVKNRNKNQ